MQNLAQLLKVKQTELKVYGNIYTPEERAYRQREIEQIMQQLGQTTQTAQGQPAQNSKSINIEKLLGKNIMAIASSLLIFISLIVLCSAIIPFMDNTIKTIAVYSVSTIFLIVGIILAAYKKTNIVMHCGLISFLISTIISYSKLLTIDEYWSFGILIAWLIVSIILTSKFKGSVTTYIGLIVISSLSLEIYIINSNFNSGIEVCTNTIILFVATIIIMFTSETYRDKPYKNILRDITLLIVSGLLLNSTVYIRNFTLLRVEPLMVIIVAAMMIYNIYRYTSVNLQDDTNTYDLKYLGFEVISISFILPITMLSRHTVIHDIQMYSLAILSVLSIILTLEYFGNKLLHTIPTLLVYSITLFVAISNSSLSIITGLAPIIIYLVYKGYNEEIITKSWTYKILALTMLFLQGFMTLAVEMSADKHLLVRYIFGENPRGSYFDYIVILFVIWQLILTLACVAYFSYKNNKQEFKGRDIISFVYTLEVMLGPICVGLTSIMIELKMYYFHIENVAVPHVIVITLLMVYILKINKKSRIVWKITNEILIYSTLLASILESKDLYITKEVMILSCIVLSCLVINWNIDKFKEYITLYNLYKFTVVSWFGTMVLFHIGFITTTTSMIISFISIIYGFKKREKYARIYGLILSIISAIKFTMFDIRSTSTIGKAISLIICGVICLIISVIYGLLEKTQQNKMKLEEHHEEINMYNQNQNI